MTPEAEYRTNLAGGKFRPMDAQQITLSLEPGTPLRLEREPTNPYDPNAIKDNGVDGVHLGYVPKNVAVHLASWMDSVWDFACRSAGHIAPILPFLLIVPIGDPEALEAQADEEADLSGFLT